MLLAESGAADTEHPVPHLLWVWPFVLLLLAIAVFPLIRRTRHWWERNANKLLVSAVLGLVTLGYYSFRGFGVAAHDPMAAAAHGNSDEPVVQTAPAWRLPPVVAPPPPPRHRYTEPGLETVRTVLEHTLLKEYIPFMVLLFSLYVIAGGIVIRGDIQATPLVNTTILAIGGVLASVVGTTGASMMLIRLLLRTNLERKRVAHTVVFFIFIVSNVGGTLLPIGDPPLFLGYLMGVDFFWTLLLWKHWAFMVTCLLAVYFVIDTWAYRHETAAAIREDMTHIEPIRMQGTINILWILVVVAAVATLDPAKPFPGTNWHAFPFLRELVQLVVATLSLLTTPAQLREWNQFNYSAIAEVAALFLGIFVTMQVPIEILNAHGAALGLDKPWQFFWATGVLSSFLDNAPTYVVFFETANALTHASGPGVLRLLDGSFIRQDLLVAISCGAVFMGANTYIGNGPNFMVKSIAEQAGVRMPSFLGFMLYSAAVLVPLFVALTFLMFSP